MKERANKAGRSKHLDIWTRRIIDDANGRNSAETRNMPLTRRDIDKYIAKKLRDMLEYVVANSSFYKERYGAAVEAYERGELDFSSLPFTTPEDLREREMELLCVRPGEISRIVTLDTGGSTGNPKRIYFTEEDQQLTVDFFENGMQLIVDDSDKVLILMPAKIQGSIGKLLAKGLRNFGADAIEYGLPAMGPGMDPIGGRQEEKKLLQLIREDEITSAVALPTHMRMLAEAARETDESAWPLKTVLLSAEYVGEADVQLIEKAFGCKVYEHYGMTEMGLGCAVSCGHGEGYHVRETDLYIEIINPDTGLPVAEGQTGEIVFTTLTRKGMPFIRYRTGDHSRWITEQCSCGSVLKRMAKVGPRPVVKGYLP